MKPAPPRLTPQAPRWITPTLLASYTRCPARAGFERDPAFTSLRRTGLRAALGQVAHAVLERRSDGMAFQPVWDEETHKVQEKLATEWAPAVPPSPSNWPGWALTLTRVAVDWPGPTGTPSDPSPSRSSLPAAGPQPAAWLREREPGPLPWRERWLHDTHTGLAGKPDLVERKGGELRVIDFKTGLAQGEATEAQREQLLFYAGVVMSLLGELPSVAAIQDASGDLHSVPVTIDEVDAVRNRAQAALAELHDAAAGKSTLAARPSEDSCSICPFRIVCADFLNEYSAAWKCGHVRAGRIVDIGMLDNHEVVDVEVVSPAWAPGQMRLVAFPFPQDKGLGQIWAFSDFEGPDSTGLARWNTLLAPWPNRP